MTPLLTKNDDRGITHIHLRRFLTEGLLWDSMTLTPYLPQCSLCLSAPKI